MLGVVACRSFEVALHVPPGFTAGPLKYLQVGTWGLLAFAMFWVLEAAVVAALLWIRMLFRSAIERFTTPIEARIAAIDATTLATLVAVLGLVWWVAITWWHSPLFSTALCDCNLALQRGPGTCRCSIALLRESVSQLWIPLRRPQLRFVVHSLALVAAARTPRRRRIFRSRDEVGPDRDLRSCPGLRHSAATLRLGTLSGRAVQKTSLPSL